MKIWFIIAILTTGLLCSCKPAGDSSAPAAPVSVAKGDVGDSYDTVISKLGTPNINSKTDHSVVLIYDQVEIKLQSNVVVTVYDHR